jgi:hypothetical protein
VRDAIPSDENLSHRRSKLIYITKKFFNFFESINNKVFIRALATVQQQIAL